MNNQPLDIKTIVDQVFVELSKQVDVILKYIKTIKFGSNNNVIQIDTQHGMWAGNADPDLAPFKLSLAGVVTSVTSISSPTLLNSWVNYGGTDATASYYKTLDNVVMLSGTVKSGSAGLIFTLPVGYRPSALRSFSIISNNAFGRVGVSSDGNVTAVVYSNLSLSLDGINFRV